MKFTQNVIIIAVPRLLGRPPRRTSVICSHGSVSRDDRIFRPHTGRWLQAIVSAALVLSGTVIAQNADSIADREVQRRQAGIPAGEAALARGKSAITAKNYTAAYQEFKTDRKSTRLNSSHSGESRMPSSA